MLFRLTHPLSSKKASPPYTVPKAPSPNLRLMTIRSRGISHSSSVRSVPDDKRPSALILSSVCSTLRSYRRLKTKKKTTRQPAKTPNPKMFATTMAASHSTFNSWAKPSRTQTVVAGSGSSIGCFPSHVSHLMSDLLKVLVGFQLVRQV